MAPNQPTVLRPPIVLDMANINVPLCYPVDDFVSPVRRLRSPFESPKHPLLPTCPSRRRKAVGSHSLRRRRGLPRLERQPHPFDQLPWISALNAAPQLSNPWDIADLSLVPEPCSEPEAPTSGPGPVRRRKSSLRSSPLDDPETRPLPLQIHPLPATPTPTPFLPSKILFRNLMPVNNDGSSPCINI
ncbi:hypothetical protein FA15DRAFT_701970 [Coprinopsis marcescibilis]|uniref:Uncharacterized protein n=1 Tax=Coprinopsis marcescibilis TaxID=230819 RepID=A0A5C3L458_COPMA|nr:hypothetical protein FA15DRAFT_701970 [Coprinopsis marcescibilis]